MKYLIPILILTIAFTLFAGSIVYLSNRYTLFFPSVSKKTWMWGFISLFVIIVICISVYGNSMHPIARIVSVFGGIAMSLFIFMLFSVAFIDLLNLFFKFTPAIRGLFSMGLPALLTIYGVWNAHHITTKEITIPIKGLTQEIRAVHITDVHLGNIWGEKQVNKIVQRIKELKPDVIFNTGDMFDNKIQTGNVNDILSAFRTLDIPHYFVNGNHDEMAKLQKVVKLMENANATVLSNEIANFGELQIIGLRHMATDENTFGMHNKPNNVTIKTVMSQMSIEENRPTIVLHHSPNGVKYMQEKGADLLLTGHTHAGQLFPFTLIAKLIFDYNSGFYKYKTINIYVSEGVGTIFLPIRLGTRSEIALIRLVPVSNID